MDEIQQGLIAFDGLSLSGKSTMVQMLFLRSLDAVVLRENELDPLRPATSRLNNFFQSMAYNEALAAVQKEYDSDLVTQTCFEAEKYVCSLGLEGPGRAKFKQATLAYFFAKGRGLVSKEVQKTMEQDKDVILDRWWVSGMAYQTQPSLGMARDMKLPTTITNNIDCEDEPYRWEDIRDLNFSFNVWVPNMQVILTCPLDQIPKRREYRKKVSTGTAGQMSTNQEDLVHHNLMKIRDWLLENGIPSIKIMNFGEPKESLDEQMLQAIPTYARMEDELRACIANKVVGGFGNFRLAERLNQDELKEFFLEPTNLQSIYNWQHYRRN